MHVERTGDRRGAHRVLARKQEGKRLYGRSNRRLDDGI